MTLLRLLAICSGPIWFAWLMSFGGLTFSNVRSWPLLLGVVCAISAVSVASLFVAQFLCRRYFPNLSIRDQQFASIGLLTGPLFGFAKILYQGHLPYTGQYGSDWPEFLIPVVGLSLVAAAIGLLVSRLR